MAQQRERKPVVLTVSNAESLKSSYASYETSTTAATSLHSTKVTPMRIPSQQKPAVPESLTDSSSSIWSDATYDSILSDMEPLHREGELDDNDDDDDYSSDGSSNYHLSDPSDSDIPPVLPPYRAAGSRNDPPVRPSSPGDFGRLFPSLDRLAVRHDDLTPDGNMNLRVDVVIPGRRSVAVQLFHLRMHDLARREFSLRRYCRDSGREVCNSKRAYVEAPAGPATGRRPRLRHSFSSALRTVAVHFCRPCIGGGSPKRPGSSGYASLADAASLKSNNQSRRASSETQSKARPTVMVPTNSIKLEFSNYARVDVTRRGDNKSTKRYEFEWWGHRYAWKRVVDKNLDSVSFHLIRDGHGAPVAHIVPEVRSPNQVAADEISGGWVTPCYMWISDVNIIDAMTDVADVIVSTGLIALVDDCIKQKWAKKPAASISSRRPSTSHANDFGLSTSPRNMVHNFFGRRHSENHQTSPMRFGRRPIAAY